jgi:subtilisin-like proprotein convertase family protein
MIKFLQCLFLTFIFQSVQAQIFTATVNATLPSYGLTNYPLVVSGLPTSANNSYGFYEVSLQINHPDATELQISLQSPAGTYLDLVDNIQYSIPLSDCSFKFFNDQHISNIKAGLIAGNLMPSDNILGAFNDGQNPNGNWNLYINDKVNNSVSANLLSWSITFKSFPYDSMINNLISDIPLIKFTTTSGVPNSPKANATMKIVDNNGVNQFSDVGQTYNIGIEKQGYTSAGGPKFNMEIEVRTANFATDSAVNILGFSTESDFVLKGAVTDNYLIKDVFTFEMSRRAGYYAPYTKFVEVMLDGEYKGLYIMEEKIKRGNNRVNVNKLTPSNITGGYIFEINPNGNAAAWYSPFPGYQGTNLVGNYEYKIVYPKAANITAPQLSYIKNVVDSFEYAMYDTTTFQNPTTGWRKWANEKSLIDFIIVSEFSNNYDTYARSMFFSKERNDKGNKIKFGPPWDADRGYDGLANNGWVHINTHGYWIFPFWYVNLRAADSLFNKRLACRYHTIRKYSLTDAAVTNLVDSLDNFIYNAKQRNRANWSVYLQPISDFKTFVLNRLAWMDANLDSLAFPANPLATATFLEGSTITLGSNASFTYNFKPGPDTSTYANIPAGDYVAEVASNYGCATRQAFSVVQNSPLAVNAIQLTATTSGVHSVLSWNIITPVSTGYFDIYAAKSTNNFKKIDRIFASDFLKTYTYIDKNGMLNRQYKVMYINNTNEKLVSNIVTTNPDNQHAGMVFYPNPASQYLHLTKNNLSTYAIINMQHKIVQAGQITDDKIDIASLPISNYIIQFTTQDGVVITQKWIKQ